MRMGPSSARGNSAPQLFRQSITTRRRGGRVQAWGLCSIPGAPGGPEPCGPHRAFEVEGSPIILTTPESSLAAFLFLQFHPRVELAPASITPSPFSGPVLGTQKQVWEPVAVPSALVAGDTASVSTPQEGSRTDNHARLWGVYKTRPAPQNCRDILKFKWVIFSKQELHCFPKSSFQTFQKL